MSSVALISGTIRAVERKTTASGYTITTMLITDKKGNDIPNISCFVDDIAYSEGDNVVASGRLTSRDYQEKTFVGLTIGFIAADTGDEKHNLFKVVADVASFDEQKNTLYLSATDYKDRRIAYDVVCDANPGLEQGERVEVSGWIGSREYNNKKYIQFKATHINKVRGFHPPPENSENIEEEDIKEDIPF